MVYILLLRGVNVGGKNKVSMGDLKKTLLDNGFEDVDSYINSGNLFFKSVLSIDFINTSEFYNEIVYVGKKAIFWGKYDEAEYLKSIYHKELIKQDFYKHITIRNGKTYEKIAEILEKKK